MYASCICIKTHHRFFGMCTVFWHIEGVYGEWQSYSTAASRRTWLWKVNHPGQVVCYVIILCVVTHTRTPTHAHTRTRTHIHTHRHTYTLTHTYIHTHSHTYIHTYTQTHMSWTKATCKQVDVLISKNQAMQLLYYCNIDTVLNGTKYKHTFNIKLQYTVLR